MAPAPWHQHCSVLEAVFLAPPLSLSLTLALFIGAEKLGFRGFTGSGSRVLQYLATVTSVHFVRSAAKRGLIVMTPINRGFCAKQRTRGHINWSLCTFLQTQIIKGKWARVLVSGFREGSLSGFLWCSADAEGSLSVSISPLLKEAATCNASSSSMCSRFDVGGQWICRVSDQRPNFASFLLPPSPIIWYFDLSMCIDFAMYKHKCIPKGFTIWNSGSNTVFCWEGKKVKMWRFSGANLTCYRKLFPWLSRAQKVSTFHVDVKVWTLYYHEHKE